MSNHYLSRIQTFTEDTLPDLDEVVCAALELFSETASARLDVYTYTKPLIIGSANAGSTGKILFKETRALFADESTYHEVLMRNSDIDAVYIISASGGKHAVRIAEELQKQELPVVLITSNKEAPGAAFVKEVLTFPHMREPYTYNTSTYMGMMLGMSSESPSDILTFLEQQVQPRIPKNLDQYQSFILMVPGIYEDLRPMFETKFDELFGPYVRGRAFTVEEVKHAKTVIPSETEFFIDFGGEQDLFGDSAHRLHIPLPQNHGPVALFALGYFVIGHIQKQSHPYFKEHIAEYAEQASKLFDQHISVIVE